ncbi:hypothetical protein [Candidatus Culexarchaeum yellowstonense]|jgi:hypothetical protein|nr:hypothetical protein [Candidatus Culexarchaeum yellowstonense]
MGAVLAHGQILRRLTQVNYNAQKSSGEAEVRVYRKPKKMYLEKSN